MKLKKLSSMELNKIYSEMSPVKKRVYGKLTVQSNFSPEKALNFMKKKYGSMR